MALTHRHNPEDLHEKRATRQALKAEVEKLQETIDGLEAPGLTSSQQHKRLMIAVPRTLQSLIRVIWLLAGR